MSIVDAGPNPDVKDAGLLIFIKWERRTMAEEPGIPEMSEDDIDGCDCPIDEADATPDEDLPAADGGVA